MKITKGFIGYLNYSVLMGLNTFGSIGVWAEKENVIYVLHTLGSTIDKLIGFYFN